MKVKKLVPPEGLEDEEIEGLEGRTVADLKGAVKEFFHDLLE